MHQHLYVVRTAAQPKQPRPAKVVQLDVRRKERREALRPQRHPSPPAA